MASSLAAAKLHTVKITLENESSMLKTLDIFQAVLFAGAMVFLSKGMKGLAISALTIGTFSPMLIRMGFAKWRDLFIRRCLAP